MNRQIRPLARREIPAAVGLVRESFATVAGELGFTREDAPRFTAFATTEERLLWQMEKEGRPMFALFVEGAMAGYYSLRMEPGAAECELNNLCVLPAYRRRGLGGMLLRDAFSRAAGLGAAVMKIGIVEENRRLRAWYEAAGFVHTGTEKLPFFPFTCGYMERALP